MVKTIKTIFNLIINNVFQNKSIKKMIESLSLNFNMILLTIFNKKKKVEASANKQLSSEVIVYFISNLNKIRLSIIKLIISSKKFLFSYTTPSNLNYFWN